MAYLNPAGSVVAQSRAVKKIIAPAGSELCLSHDGKKLLYTRTYSKTAPDRTIVLYDADSGNRRLGARSPSAKLSGRSTIRASLFSERKISLGRFGPSRRPCLKAAGRVFSTVCELLHGWLDNHTVPPATCKTAYWLSEDKPQQTVLCWRFMAARSRS